MLLGIRSLCAALTAALACLTIVAPAPAQAEPTTYLAPINRACGTWVLQQVSTATELSRQASAIDQALAQPGVVGLSLRVPWDALEKDPSLLDKGLALADARGKEFAIRFMAGRWTPDRVFNDGAYSFTSAAGDTMPAPFAPNGTAGNPVFEREFGETVTWLADWSRAHDVSVLHVPWYGFQWAEIYNGSEIEALPNYSWTSWLEGHRRLAEVALAHGGPDLAIEFAMSGHWGARGAGANDVTNALIGIAGDNSPELIIQGNGMGMFSSKTTNRPVLHAKQMYDGKDYDWKSIYSTLTANDERYLEVYTTSFAQPNKAILASEAAKFASACDRAAPGVELDSPGSVVQGQVPLSAAVVNDPAPSTVEILVDGVVVATGTGPRLTTTWDTTGVADGVHEISARACDANGNRMTTEPVSVSVENNGSTPPPPVLSVGSVEVVEGDAGESAAQVTFTLSDPATQPVTAAYTMADGTATAGTDYVAGTGQVTIPSGATSVVQSLPVTGDTIDEPDETFSVIASAPAGATLGDDTGTVTIADDDVAPPPAPPALSIADATVTEGNSGTKTVSVTVRLDKAPTSAVTVKYGTSNGTAKSGTDYSTSSGTVRFAAGVRTATFTLTIRNDKVREQTEKFNVTLSSPTGATTADKAAVVTINDND